MLYAGIPLTHFTTAQSLTLRVRVANPTHQDLPYRLSLRAQPHNTLARALALERIKYRRNIALLLTLDHFQPFIAQ